MTRDELLARLRALQGDDQDPERAHSDADDLLLQYIDDPEIEAAYEQITKWYA